MKKLSIIIPVYNEEKTLFSIVERLQKLNLPLEKEIVIVNDASLDDSQKIINDLKSKYNNIFSFLHNKNMGKGAAIRTGLKNISGDVFVVQDGDLEYNPEDFKKMLNIILKNESDVVYGSRLLGHVTGFSIKSHYYGNKFLSMITKILYNQKITDMETCYKMMKKKVIKNINLKSNKFDIEPEITSKIIKNGYKIKEIPIDYNCRSYEDGKKITWKDGISAIFTLFKYRFTD